MFDYLLSPPVIELGFIVYTGDKSWFFHDKQKALLKLLELTQTGVKAVFEPINSNSPEKQFISEKLIAKGFTCADMAYYRDAITDQIYVLTVVKKCHKIEYLDGSFMLFQVYAMENGLFVKAGEPIVHEVLTSSNGLFIQHNGLRFNLRKFVKTWIKTQ